jgi:hypothetical protein
VARQRGGWLRVRLSPLTEDDVATWVADDVRSAEVSRHTVSQVVYRVGHGHPGATQALITALSTTSTLVHDIEGLLTASVPGAAGETSVHAAILDVIVDEASVELRGDPALRRDLVTVAAARNRAEAASVVATGPVTLPTDERAVLRSPVLWSGPGETMPPAVRYVLLRELAARDDDHLASWRTVYQRVAETEPMADAAHARHPSRPELHHRLALGEIAAVSRQLLADLAGCDAATWLAMLEAVTETPDPRLPVDQPRTWIEAVLAAEPGLDPAETAMAQLLYALRLLGDPRVVPSSDAWRDLHRIAARGYRALADTPPYPAALSERAQRHRDLAADRQVINPGWSAPAPPPVRISYTVRGRWWRPVAAAIAATALVAGGVVVVPWAVRHARCPAAWSVWWEAGECVGVSDGTAFLDSRFAAVTEAIAKENDLVEQGGIPNSGDGTTCTATGRRWVSIAAMAPWDSVLSGSRSVHELEGMFVAQWRANHLGEPDGCQPFVRLLIANPGRDAQAWRSVVDDLAARVDGTDHLVAVVGLGLSKPETAELAHRLSDRQIPMVADLVTAIGFDRSNFAGVPTACTAGRAPSGEIRNFKRLAFDTHRQVVALAKVRKTAGSQAPWDWDSVLQVTQFGYQDDPYVCATVTAANKEIAETGPARDPLTFQLSDDGTDTDGYLARAVGDVCANTKVHTVFYTARAIDLAAFVAELDQRCGRAITVLSTSDASRLRAPEPDDARETKRTHGLGALVGGHRIRLLYTPLAHPEVYAGQADFNRFAQHFTGRGFAEDDLRDGWAIVGHDAMFTLTTAIHQKQQRKDRDGEQSLPTIRDVADNLGGKTVTGAAEGALSFDDNGNRTDEPTVVRLCHNALAVPMNVDSTLRCPDDRS